MRPVATALILGLWGGASLFLLATLSVTHLATYQLPQALAPLIDFARSRRSTPGRRLVLHFIPETCSCTNGLFNHLIARGPLDATDEHIVFVEPSGTRAARARDAGYAFSSLTAETAVAQLGVTAAPLLLVLDKDDSLRYAGGYFDHPAAIDPLDLDVLSQLDADGHAEALPMFGCALSEELQRAVDPLGLTTTRR